MTPPGCARAPGPGAGGPRGTSTPWDEVPLDVLMTRRVMVITIVMYYKCKAPPRTYHYMTFVIKYI